MHTTRLGWIASLVILWTVGVGCGASPVPDAASSAASTASMVSTTSTGAQDAAEAEPARLARVEQALDRADRVSHPDTADVRIVLHPSAVVESGAEVFTPDMQNRLQDIGFDPQTDALDMWTWPGQWSRGPIDLGSPFVLASWRNDEDLGSIAAFGRDARWSGRLSDVAAWWWSQPIAGESGVDPVLGRPVYATEFGVWVDLDDDIVLVSCAVHLEVGCHLEAARLALGPRPVAARDVGWSAFRSTIDPAASQLYLATEPDAFSSGSLEQHALWSVEHTYDEGGVWRIHRRLAYDPAQTSTRVRRLDPSGGVRVELNASRALVAAAHVTPDAFVPFAQAMIDQFAAELVGAMDRHGFSLDPLADIATGEVALIGVTRPALPGLDVAGLVAAMRVDDIAAADAWLDDLRDAARAGGALIPTFDDGDVRWIAFGPAGLVLTIGRAGDLLVVGRHTLAVAEVLSNHTDAFVSDPGGASIAMVADGEGLVDLLLGMPSSLGAATGRAVGTMRLTGRLDPGRTGMTVDSTAEVDVQHVEALLVEALDGAHADVVSTVLGGFVGAQDESRDHAMDESAPTLWPPDPDGLVVMELDVAATRRLNARTDLLADQVDALERYERRGFVLVLTDGTDLAWSIDEVDDAGEYVARGWAFGTAEPTDEDGVWIIHSRSFVDGSDRTARLVFDRTGGAVVEFPTPLALQVSDAVLSPWEDPLVTRLHGRWEPDMDRTAHELRSNGVDEAEIETAVVDFEEAAILWEIRPDGVLQIEMGGAPPHQSPWRPSFALSNGFAWVSNEGLSSHMRFGWDDGSIGYSLDDGTIIWFRRVDE